MRKLISKEKEVKMSEIEKAKKLLEVLEMKTHSETENRIREMCVGILIQNLKREQEIEIRC